MSGILKEELLHALKDREFHEKLVVALTAEPEPAPKPKKKPEKESKK